MIYILFFEYNDFTAMERKSYMGGKESSTGTHFDNFQFKIIKFIIVFNIFFK